MLASPRLSHVGTFIVFAQELYRRAGTLWPEARLFQQGTRHGAEVDFVLEVDRKLWGIEVKSTRTASSDMLTGLTSLGERAKRLTRKILLCIILKTAVTRSMSECLRH